MQKIFIENRKGQKLCVVVNKNSEQKGLVFVMHGLGGYKEQPHIQTFAKAFADNDFTTVLFDAANTFGESEGNYEDATVTNYYEDLEDVIKWSEKQSWYEEPFCLAGHSLGGMCITLYAEKYSEKVRGLIPSAGVVSGKLLHKSYVTGEELKKWEETGWTVRESSNSPGLLKKLKWNFMEDILNYDLINSAEKLTMPVLQLSGELDNAVPIADQQKLFDKIPADEKKFHIIKGAPHTYINPEHLEEIKLVLDKWIKKHILE